MFRELALKENGTVTNKKDLIELGKIANDFAKQNVFQHYHLDKAENTINRHKRDLKKFEKFLKTREVDGKPIEVGDLATEPQSWEGVSWGLVSAYQLWLLNKGYAVGTVNVLVSTVKLYSKLAFRAGAIDAEQYALIRSVEGYSQSEKTRIRACVLFAR